MIITISGMSGSGKNTVGEKVADVLRMRTVEYTFKDHAKEMGINLMDFQKMARKDESIDRDFDKLVVRSANRGNCVITTWLGPWSVKRAKLRVWLDADEKVRAKRIAKREGMSQASALAHLRKRDKDNILRYKKLYGIDIRNREIFDLIVNTERFLPDDIADMVIVAARCIK
ncbi:MAG: (d)CMP kinase [Candidatus Micrarchaeota archaeon]